MKTGGQEGLCCSCLEVFARPWAGGCPICGRTSGKAEGKVCADCLRNPPHYRRCVAVGRYEGGLRQAIHRFKYQLERRLAQPLGYLLSLAALREFGPDFLVLPVPLYVSRQRRRGYNHSEILAWEVTRRLGWDLGLDILVRIRDTGSQAKLSLQERCGNVIGAFAVTGPSGAQAASGRKILLLDDVVTTGSTLSECARVLTLAGASQVGALVLASTDRRV